MFQIAAKINQPGAGGGDGAQPLKRPFESDGNSYGMLCLIQVYIKIFVAQAVDNNYGTKLRD